jgi:hypothetical protein
MWGYTVLERTSVNKPWINQRKNTRDFWQPSPLYLPCCKWTDLKFNKRLLSRRKTEWFSSF